MTAGPRLVVIGGAATVVGPTATTRVHHRHDRAMLVMLALARGDHVERARLAPVCDGSARKARDALTRIASLLGSDADGQPGLERNSATVRLLLPTDVDEFARRWRQADRQVEAGRKPQARRRHESAAALWAAGNEVVGAVRASSLDVRGAADARSLLRRRAEQLRQACFLVAEEGGPPRWLQVALDQAVLDDPSDDLLAHLLTSAVAATSQPVVLERVVQRHAERLAEVGLGVGAVVQAVAATRADPTVVAEGGGFAGLLALAAGATSRRGSAGSALVGRGSVLAQLHDAWEATAEEPAVVLVVGPRGSGRTAVLRAVDDRVRGDGADVVWLRAADGALLVGDVWLRPPNAPKTVRGLVLGAMGLAPTTSATEVDDYLRGHPLVLLIDDIDDAAPGVAHDVVEFMRNVVTGRLLVVASADGRSAVALTADGLVGAQVLYVDYLRDGQAARLLRRRAPTLGPDHLRRLHEQAAGVPGRIVALAAVSTSELDITNPVLEEVAMLDPPSRLLMEVIATAGSWVPSGTLARAATALGLVDYQAVVDQLVRARLVGSDDLHVWVAPALGTEIVAKLPPWRAAVAHRAVAAALTTVDFERAAGHRWSAALAGVDPTGASSAAIAAGRLASSQSDHLGAARWFAEARRLAPIGLGVTSDGLAEMLILEGEALGWVGHPDALPRLEEAADLARASGSRSLLARALTVTGGDLGGNRRWDTAPIDELRDLLHQLPPDAHADRGRVLSTLAWLLSSRLDADAASDATRRAMDAAEASGDPAVLARAQMAYLETEPHDHDLARRADVIDRLLAAGRLLGDQQLVAIGLAHMATLRFALAGADGEGTGLSEVVDLVRRLHRDHRMSFAQPARSLLRLVRGDLGGAERLIRVQLLAKGATAVDDDLYTALLLQLAAVLRWRGELGAFFDGTFTPPTGLLEGPGQVAMVVALAELGQTDAAAEQLPDVVAGLARSVLAFPSARLVVFGLAAEACVLTGQADLAAPLMAQLRPAAEAGLNCSAWVHAWMGSASHQLGALAVLTGDHDEARTWLDDAERRHRMLGATPYLASTLLTRARLERQAGNGAGLWETPLTEALALARADGLRVLERAASALVDT